MSRPFSALLRYAPHELLGMPFSRLLYSDEDQPATSPGIAAILSQPGELRLCTADGQPVWVRVSSFGVSLADRTAYRVVHVERVINRRGVSGAVLNRSAPRLNVEREARNAMANGWLVLHYQPVIDLRTSQLTGAEALLRIAHPEHGLLAPGVFIDALEDSDLILPIGDWVLGEACCQLRRWQDALGIKEFSMAVNISGRQASDRALSGRALAAAASAGIDPHSLCLEMTERVLIAADEPVVAGLRHLTAEGVRIALDDFGTGYASLSYLQRFPVSVLKIDRSFVTGVGVTPTDSAIVASIVALGQALDLEVVAEGVETANQLKQLRMHQCSKAQGFFFAPPLTAEDFEAHWRRKLRTNLSGVVNTRSARRHG